MSYSLVYVFSGNSQPYIGENIDVHGEVGGGGVDGVLSMGGCGCQDIPIV